MIWAIRGSQEREMKEVTINFLSIYLVELSLAPEGGSGRDLPGRLCLDARSRNMSGGLLVGLPSCPSISIPMGTFVESSLNNSFSFLSQLPIPLFPPLFCVTSWQVCPLKCHFPAGRRPSFPASCLTSQKNEAIFECVSPGMQLPVTFPSFSELPDSRDCLVQA